MQTKSPEMLQVLLRRRRMMMLSKLVHTSLEFTSTQTLAQGNQGLALEERGEVE
jgi:hypothetical protein